MAREEIKRLRGDDASPKVLVTDNGTSFLAKAFKTNLADAGIEHVRIQYRTPQQLGLLERFHGTLKREEVYWNE